MWDQNCLVWVFLGWNSKKLLYCGIFHQHPQIFLNIKLQRKIKVLEFGTKKCLIWVLLGCNLQKAIVIFEISVLQFALLQSLVQKIKTL